jgi:hypothetical protein
MNQNSSASRPSSVGAQKTFGRNLAATFHLKKSEHVSTEWPVDDLIAITRMRSDTSPPDCTIGCPERLLSLFQFQSNPCGPSSRAASGSFVPPRWLTPLQESGEGGRSAAIAQGFSPLDSVMPKTRPGMPRLASRAAQFGVLDRSKAGLAVSDFLRRESAGLTITTMAVAMESPSRGYHKYRQHRNDRFVSRVSQPALSAASAKLDYLPSFGPAFAVS